MRFGLDHCAPEILGLLFGGEFAREQARFGGPTRAVGRFRVIELFPLAAWLSHEVKVFDLVEKRKNARSNG